MQDFKLRLLKRFLEETNRPKVPSREVHDRHPEVDWATIEEGPDSRRHEDLAESSQHVAKIRT